MTCAFFLYTRSSDVEASRRFYSELLGLHEIWHEAGMDVSYKLGDDAVQLSIEYDADTPRATQWASQPGWVLGLGVEPRPRRATASWSIALEPSHFRGAVARLRDAAVEALRPEPFWVGYWSFVVKDPMGQTVELSDPHSDGPGGPLPGVSVVAV